MRKYYVNGVERTKKEYIDILQDFFGKNWDVYYYETVYYSALVDFGDLKFQCTYVLN